MTAKIAVFDDQSNEPLVTSMVTSKPSSVNVPSVTG
jgi:hypothetical protein